MRRAGSAASLGSGVPRTVPVSIVLPMAVLVRVVAPVRVAVMMIAHRRISDRL